MNILSYLAGRYGDKYPGRDLPAYLMGKAAGSAAVVWKTVSGALVHITDALARPAKSLIVKIEPVQEGSGDPSPTNVRPISGHTGAAVQKRGKNLLDSQYEKVESNNIYSYEQNKFLLKKGVTYVYNTTVPRSGIYISGDGIDVRDYSLQNPIIYTPTEDVLVFFNAYWADSRIPSGGLSADMVYLNVATDQGYEAFRGETIPVSWETEAGTVYGGEVDVVSGKLVAEYVLKTIKRFTGVFGEGSYGTAAYVVDYDITRAGANVERMMSNVFTYDENSYTSMPLYSYVGGSGASTTYTFIIPKGLSTTEAANAWLAEQPPITYMAKLVKPIEYDLTPQAVTLFAGENNIWNDVGETEITYAAQ